MVTIPECEGLFEPLLRILEDKMAATEDHVDAYLRLTDRLRLEEDVFVSEILHFLARLIVVFKRDIQSDKSDLCQASLQALGHCFHQQQIASSICLPGGQELVESLLDRIQGSEDKGVCTRALWCLAKQNLDNEIINKKLESILSTLELVITRDLQSVTVDHEALSVIERLVQQAGKSDLIQTADCWSKLVFPMLVSSASKIRERALIIMSAGLEHLISSQEKVVKILVPLLKGCLLKEFPKLCSERKELFVLKCWCCIVPILGETLHRGGSLINDLLKLVEQGFRDQSIEVQVMSFTAWNILIDNFSLSPDVLCSPRRVKLIMTPLRNLAVKERNEAVEAARLSTWWHFVCLLGPRVRELFEQVCTPLLQFVFGTAIDQVSLLKTKEGLGDLKCPPTPTNNKLMVDMMAETPKSSIRRSLRDVGTPRTPTVLNASFAKTAKQKLLSQGCEILLEFLMLNGDEINGNPALSTSLGERLQIVTFKRPEDFKKFACLIMSSVREGFKALGKDIGEPLGVKIWSLLVARVSKLLEKGSSSDFSEILLPLLAVMEDLVDSNLLPPSLTLKMLGELSDLSAEVLSHHMAPLHSKENPQGSPALLLVQLLFTPHLLENIWENERLHLAFEHLIACGMTAASGQLFFLKTVLNLLEKASSSVIKKDVLWRLWSCVVDQLNEHIQKTNDVNQGDALEHDFSTLYLALQFPMKHLLDAGLSQSLAKEVSKKVAELYRSFSRAAALVPTSEANVCCEELCGKILADNADWSSKDLAFVDNLVSLGGVIIECLDFSMPGLFGMATTAAGKSPHATPTKWNKRLQKPMGNLTSLVHMIAKLLSTCERTSDHNESSQTLGILTAITTSLIDKLSYLFVHISGTSTITAILQTLAPSLRNYLESAHTSTKITQTTMDKRLFTARLIQKIEKLWTDLLTCVQTRHCGPYNSDFLTVLSPLMEVTFGHPKRNIKNHAVMFWNATFANTQSLNYPEKLRPVLQVAKDKMSLTLPGWEDIQVSVKETQMDLESEDLTQQTDIIKPLPYGILTSPQRNKPISLSGGSPQMKGSFLHRTVAADKALENPSPKMFGRSPKPGRPRNSPAGMHVRRKLPLSKYDDDHQDYVMIAPSPKKKRLLTEHQKEILRSRSDVPALYNELDRSQDCTQFSQFSLAASQAQITPDTTPSSSPEEGKNVFAECSKTATEVDPRKENGCEIDVVSEKNEIEIRDDNQQVICDPQVDSVDGEKVAAFEKEVVKAVEKEGEEHNSVTRERNVIAPSSKALAKSDDADVNDVVRLENELSTSEEECEVTSPDIIPSSQTPSFESQFQSIKRVSIPLSCFLPSSHDSLSRKGTAAQRELEKTQLEIKDIIEDSPVEICGENDAVERNKADKCDSLVKKDKEDEAAWPVSKTIVSPVAGRTRRKLQQKTEAEKALSQTESEDEPTEQEVSKQTDSGDDIEKKCTQKSPEKAAEPSIAGLSREATSSPVPNVTNKFLRPLSAGGSPCRTTLRGPNSPGVSPTTGILKRWPGNKQSVDSPSPPAKVRRVSFALPAKDNSCEDAEEKSSDTRNCASQPKASNSSPFTAVKQRRLVPAYRDQLTSDSTGCVFPDLVSCTVPVEQILPSILTMSWSRGLGHLVRAQNIHTIGNLSALKEEQVNNLPIKSPKVLTLKRALRRFHLTHKGKNSKPLAQKLLAEASLKEDIDSKEDVISSEHAQFRKKVVDEKDSDKEFEVTVSEIKCVEERRSSEPEVTDNVDGGKMASTDELMLHEPYVEVELGNENAAPPANCEKIEGDSVDEETEGSDKGVSLTPPLPAHDTDTYEVTTDTLTPGQETCASPSRLFTNGKTDTGFSQTEEMLPLDKSKENEETTQITELCDQETKISELVGLASPVLLFANEAAAPTQVEAVVAVKKENVTEREKFCDCLRSLKELASPEVLRDFSTEEIFEAHQNLTEVMSVVVQALRGHCRSPKSEK